MEKRKPKIIFKNSGIGALVTDKNKKWIEMNKNLKKYPKLYEDILRHEMLHYKSKNKYIDFKIDLFDKAPKGLWRFIIKHPKALTEFLPVWTNHRGRLTPNYLLCLVYSLLVMILIMFFLAI